jgi:hypothetical protein
MCGRISLVTQPMQRPRPGEENARPRLREEKKVLIHKRAVALALVFVLMLALPMSAFGDEIGKLLKILGTGIIVDRFGKQINDAINTLLLNNKVEIKDATKVVPILSIGSGGHVGAAQVSGPQDKVDQVEAVFQVEGNWNSIRLKALVPSDSKNPLKLNRVEKVGVSAIIDIKL